MSSYNPGRPANVQDTTVALNGTPVYLGALVSTGAAVNNFTTATPFNGTPRGPGGMFDTLAGKMLLVQTSAAGLILPATVNTITITTQTTTPGLGLVPGVLLGAQERVIVLMLPTAGWLQWLPSSGSANLFIWELV